MPCGQCQSPFLGCDLDDAWSHAIAAGGGDCVGMGLMGNWARSSGHVISRQFCASSMSLREHFDRHYGGLVLANDTHGVR